MRFKPFLPSSNRTAGGLTISFSMLNAVHAGTSQLNIQHSSDLGVNDPWATETIPQVSGISGDVTFVITPSSPTRNTVQATISTSSAANGKLFIRLQSEQP